jgi:chromosome segregation ATPase
MSTSPLGGSPPVSPRRRQEFVPETLSKSSTKRKSPIAESSLTAWETVFKPGGSKAIEFNLIELREGSDKYSRIYLVALGSITAVRSLIEAPVALGRLVIEITEWAVNFERTKGEVFGLVYTEVSDCLRCVKMAFIVTGLTVGGVFIPSWCFGALKNMPKTHDFQAGEKGFELSRPLEKHKDPQNQIAALQAKITSEQRNLTQIQEKGTAEKEKLTRILETIAKQGESLAEAERLEARVELLTRLELGLASKHKTHRAQIEQLTGVETTVTQKIQAARAELAGVRDEITTEQAALAQCRETLKSLSDEHEALLPRQTELTTCLSDLAQEETALRGRIEPLVAREKELTEQIRLKETTSADQERTLGEKQVEHKQLQAQINELKQSVTDFAIAKDTLEHMQKEINKLAPSVQELEKEKESSAAAVSNFHKRNEDLKTTNKDLDEQIAAKKGELEKEIARVAKAKTNLEKEAQEAEKAIKTKTAHAEQDLKTLEARAAKAKADAEKEAQEKLDEKAAEMKDTLMKKLEIDMAAQRKQLSDLMAEVKALEEKKTLLANVDNKTEGSQT